MAAPEPPSGRIELEYNATYRRVNEDRTKESAYVVLCYDCAKSIAAELERFLVSRKPCANCGR